MQICDGKFIEGGQGTFEVQRNLKASEETWNFLMKIEENLKLLELNIVRDYWKFRETFKLAEKLKTLPVKVW